MSHSATSIKQGARTYLGVKRVTTAENYRLILEFDNEEKRVFDLTPLLKVGRFQTLVSPELFNRVRVVFDTVEWENGLDLDPEYLYHQSIPLSQ